LAKWFPEDNNFHGENMNLKLTHCSQHHSIKTIQGSGAEGERILAIGKWVLARGSV